MEDIWANFSQVYTKHWILFYKSSSAICEKYCSLTELCNLFSLLATMEVFPEWSLSKDFKSFQNAEISEENLFSMLKMAGGKCLVVP